MQKKKKKSNVQNESRKLSLFYITPFFLTNVQNKVGLHSAQPIMFSIFYITLKSPAGSLPFLFFSLLFSYPHTSSHMYSSISTLLRLSFKFPLIFVILCCLPLSSTFFPLCASSSTVQLISASSHLTFLHFSLKFLTLAFLFCFIFFVRYVCLLHFFLLLLFFLVEILVLQSKLHVGRIRNFSWYLSRVS